MNTRPYLALSIALSFAASPALAGSLPPGFDDNPTVVDAVAKARSSGKPVIVYYSEHDCTACGALDGWLVRGDIRQTFGPGYHFSVVFGSDLVPQERERWKATYSPRGAPSWVVLAADGSYLCTSTGGFANATAALELHKVLVKAAAKVKDARAADAKVIEVKADDNADDKADDTRARGKLAAAAIRPRPCSASALGV